MDLWRLGASDLADGYRKGDFTPSDVLASVAARIEAVNPLLNAIVIPNLDAAGAEAAASTARWAAGTPKGALDGVPITVKDNIPVAGLRCTWGSRAYEAYLPDRDEYAVSRLRAAGVLILGKTNVPEFTLQGFTFNKIFGTTGNPWNPDLTPGGSSGGAVAAVASGMGVAALCTDGGGSIRRPAAHTGLYGLKTSPGFIGRADTLPALLGDFETMGAIARSPRDLRIMLGVIAASHPEDRASQAFSAAGRAAQGDGARPRRILCIPRFGSAPVDPDIRASFDGALRVLEAMGHYVETGEVPFDVDALNAIWGLIGPAGLAWLVDDRKIDPALLNETLLPMIETGRAARAPDYVALLAEVHDFRAKLARLFEKFDLIFTPSVAALPWPKNESHPEIIDGTETGPRGHAIFTPFANAGGLPGITIPTAPAANGLPIGCQLVGPYGSDLDLLALAEAYEQQTGAFRWPAL